MLGLMSRQYKEGGVTEHVRAWRKKNPDKALAISRRRAATPEFKAYARRAKLLKRYNLTVEEYDALLRHQGGVCAVCSRPPSAKMRLAVDHDHKAEKERGMRASVRGLLHSYPCNYVLLRKGFTAPMFRAAADYLDNPPAQECLAG